MHSILEQELRLLTAPAWAQCSGFEVGDRHSIYGLVRIVMSRRRHCVKAWGGVLTAGRAAGGAPGVARGGYRLAGRRSPPTSLDRLTGARGPG